MDDSADFNDRDNSITLEAESCLKTESIDGNSENYCFKDLDNPNLEENKSRRRSGRTLIKNHLRYTDEDCNSNSSHNNTENNYISTEDILSQEATSSTTLKNSMSKRKRNNLFEALGQALTEIGLYDELFEFMKSKGITADALKYMQTRHIDELFRGTKLSTKIIFEHNLKEWQNKNGICEVSTTQINHANINTQGVQLLPQMNMSSRSLNETEISSLSNHLTSAVQEAINKVLQEFSAPFKQCQQFNSFSRQFYDEGPVEENTIRNIKTEPNFSSEEAYASDKSCKRIGKKLEKFSNTANDVLNSNQSFETITPQSKRRKTNNDNIVNEILSTLQIGQNLVNEYKKNGVFTSNQRFELVRTVVEFYLRKNQIMSVILCKRIAEEIVELFPTETIDFYFKQENKSKVPRGKIWEQYQSRKRSTRKMNGSNATEKEIIKRENSIDTQDSDTKIDWSDMESMCSEMKYIHDEKLLLEKWKDSFEFRRHQLQTGCFSNWKKFFDEYPFCKQQNYAKFIESDLDTLYPNLKFNDFLWDEFIKHFSTFFSNRIKHPQSKIIFEQLIADNQLECSNDYVAIKVVNLLHAVLRPNGKQLQSVEDAQRQFTVEVTDLSDLKKVVIARKKLCADSNIQARPYIAVVGDNKSYSHFSVILDSTGFSCDNYKDSLILCFNLYLFFELSFPYESINVWTFIQQYFFNKPTLVNNPRVESFINDIKAQKLVIFESNVNERK